MEVSKSLPNRHAIAATISKNCEHLDILYRKSDGRGPFNIPFMRWVAKETGNEMTHAAILYSETTDDGAMVDLVLELSDTGFCVYRLVDWLNFCIDGEFQLHRVKMTDDQAAAIDLAVQKFVAEDPDYDATFSNGWYCTKFVCKMFEAGGIKLQEPKTTRQLCGWLKAHRISILNNFVKWISKGQYCLPVDTPLFFVGNNGNGGMVAYPEMERIL